MTRKLIALMILCLLPFSFVSAPQAAEKTGSITLHYAASDAKFDIYLVGSSDSSGNITLNSDYSYVDAAEKTAAETLSKYISLVNVLPTASGTTDSSGDLTFSGLAPGAYLVVGTDCVVDDVSYTASPVLLSVSDDLTTSDPKYSTSITTTTTTIKQSTTTKLSVKKVWKNDDSSSRPKSVKVSLLRNGKVYDTQTLSSSNNWSYTWNRLDGSKSWSVVEKSVPDGYRVSIKQNGSSYTITNKGISITTKTTTRTKTTTDTTTTSKKLSGLPQTGQLWWPVSLLAFLGTALLIIGLVLRKRS